jgi:hypothetical protein
MYNYAMLILKIVSNKYLSIDTQENLNFFYYFGIELLVFSYNKFSSIYIGWINNIDVEINLDQSEKKQIILT